MPATIHIEGEVKSHLRTRGSVAWPSSRASRPALMRLRSASFASFFCSGSSRNQGKKKEIHTTPRSPAAQKPSRQEGNVASQWSPVVWAAKFLKACDSKPFIMPPKITGEKAPPQRESIHRIPPNQARD